MSLQDNTNDTLFSADFASLLSNRGNVHRPRWHGGTYFIIPQAEKGTYRNTHRPPFTSAEYRLGNLEHAPRQWRLGNAVLFFRDRKNLSLKHVSQLKKSIFLNNQFDPQECPRWSEKASLPPPLPPCLLPLLCLVLTLDFCSGMGRGGSRGAGERPWSKVSMWQQEPSICYFKLWTADRTFCFLHTRGREISGKIKRVLSSENHKNRISSDKLPSGMEKTAFGVVCWEEHIFLSGTEALPFDVWIPRLRHAL